jgi:hypothetical protein
LAAAFVTGIADAVILLAGAALVLRLVQA